MRHDSRGRRALQKTLQTTNGVDVARVCRVTKSAVSHWANGTCRPSDSSRAILETRYKIPAESWYQPAKRKAKRGSPPTMEPSADEATAETDAAPHDA